MLGPLALGPGRSCRGRGAGDVLRAAHPRQEGLQGSPRLTFLRLKGFTIYHPHRARDGAPAARPSLPSPTNPECSPPLFPVAAAWGVVRFPSPGAVGWVGVCLLPCAGVGASGPWRGLAGRWPGGPSPPRSSAVCVGRRRGTSPVIRRPHGMEGSTHRPVRRLGQAFAPVWGL